jgi:hypothetical protein
MRRWAVLDDRGHILHNLLESYARRETTATTTTTSDCISGSSVSSSGPSRDDGSSEATSTMDVSATTAASCSGSGSEGEGEGAFAFEKSDATETIWSTTRYVLAGKRGIRNKGSMKYLVKIKREYYW